MEIIVIALFEGLPGEESRCLLLLGSDWLGGLRLEDFGSVGIVEGYFGGGYAGVDGLHFFLELNIQQHCLVLLSLCIHPCLDKSLLNWIRARA